MCIVHINILYNRWWWPAPWRCFVTTIARTTPPTSSSSDTTTMPIKIADAYFLRTDMHTQANNYMKMFDGLRVRGLAGRINQSTFYTPSSFKAMENLYKMTIAPNWRCTALCYDPFNYVFIYEGMNMGKSIQMYERAYSKQRNLLCTKY